MFAMIKVVSRKNLHQVEKIHSYLLPEYADEWDELNYNGNNGSS